jgi:hypothetical protein
MFNDKDELINLRVYTTNPNASNTNPPPNPNTTNPNASNTNPPPNPNTTNPSDSETDSSTKNYNDNKKINLNKEIDRIDKWASIASNNGLFREYEKKIKKEEKEEKKRGKKDEYNEKVKENNSEKIHDDIFCEIQEKIKYARVKLNNNELPQSDFLASEALELFNKALYKVSSFWRFRNFYGGFMWIYLTGFLIGIFVFYYYSMDISILNLNVKIEQDALYAASWGAVGGILRGLWYLKDAVNSRIYEESSRMYFLSIPFIASIFGAFVYFFLILGSYTVLPQVTVESLQPNNMTVSNGNESISEGPASTETRNPPPPNIAIVPFALLAGFNWEWTIVIFKRIGDSFKNTSEPDYKIGELK